MLAQLAIHLVPAVDTNFRPPDTPVDVFANGELWIGSFLILAFTLFYGFRFRWWKTADKQINYAGIAVFSIFVALSALLVYSVGTRLLTHGDYPLRDLFRAIVYFLLPASGVFMFVALFKSRDQLLRELRAEQRHFGPETPVSSDTEA